MNTRAIRLKKEVRALFWPWCLVMTAAVLPAILPHRLQEPLRFVSFFLGVPLLATLSLGFEFQHRTFSLWLTQPAGRIQLWAEKMLVMFSVVLSTALVSGIYFYSTSRSDLNFNWEMATGIAWVLASTASAPYWTLTARSILGGLALNSCLQWWLIFGFAWIAFGKEPWRIMNPELPAGIIAATVITGIGYAAMMLWLGARKLKRFQVTGEAAGGDLLMSGPPLMPEALARGFRCRPSGVYLNLIRKELRLLRPLWMLTAVVLVYVAFVQMFELLPDPAKPGPPDAIHGASLVFVTIFCLLLAILSGSLSMGEERNLGTHVSNLTLPVSARRQWLIKLMTATLAGLVCAVLLPLLVFIAVASLSGTRLLLDFDALQVWTLVILLVSVASFWCACAAKGTVYAALSVFPLTGAIFFSAIGGIGMGETLALITGTVKDLVVSWFHLNPLAGSRVGPRGLLSGTVLVFFPVFVAGLLQSYRLFRAQPPDSALGVVRRALPLAALSLLWCLSLSAGFASSRWEPFNETRRALDQLQPGRSQMEVRGEDLASRVSLSSTTERWLKGATITVAPDVWGYRATIHLPGGLGCRLTVAHFQDRTVISERPSCGD